MRVQADADQLPSAPPLAVEDLWTEHYARLVDLAAAMVGSRARGEELVQDAFAKVLKRYDTIANPGGYIRTTVVNGAKSELRKREVRRRLGRTAAGPATVDADDEYLTDALHRLSPNRRIAIVLRYYADLSDEQIGEHLGVRPATVRSLLARGIADLREVIDR